MVENKNIPVDNPDIDKTLLQAIERGIDDLENDRVLPLESAMKMVEEIRKSRRQIRA